MTLAAGWMGPDPAMSALGKSGCLGKTILIVFLVIAFAVEMLVKRPIIWILGKARP